MTIHFGKIQINSGIVSKDLESCLAGRVGGGGEGEIEESAKEAVGRI